MFHSLLQLLFGPRRCEPLRSGRWRSVRQKHLLVYPFCAACGGSRGVEVHHKIPVHVEPLLELDSTNLITLCERGPGGMNCHLVFGHLGDWKKYNPRVVDDAAYFKRMLDQLE